MQNQKFSARFHTITAIAVLLLVTGLFLYKTNVNAASPQAVFLASGQQYIVRCAKGTLFTDTISETSIRIACSPNRKRVPTPTPLKTPSTTIKIPYTPSVTPSQTASPTPAPSNEHQTPAEQDTARSLWHPPGAHDGLNTHEHGDAPPDWANSFSQTSFGHPVIFGGDESTPMENDMKHQAYKGFLMHVSGVDLYFRHHSQSNPHGRSAPFHSYEVYAKDSSGNVSFWQGWQFYGYPERRDQRMTRRNEQPGYDQYNGITWPGRSQFIISAPDKIDWDNYLRCEQWYGHGGLWSWDVSITICGASTLYSVDEHTGDIKNMNTWNKTGDVGSSRRLEVTHYGPQNPRVGGESLPVNQWFCVKMNPNEQRDLGNTPTWTIGNAVSGPKTCSSGYLPQFIADTFPKKGVYFETGNTAEKTFPVSGVTLPN